VKLTPARLPAHLSSGVAPVYLVSGEEPLLVDECLDKIRSAAREQGCDERVAYVIDRHFDWSTLDAGRCNLSLFGSRTLVELRLPGGKPGDKGSKYLVDLVESRPADTVTVVITPKLDRRAEKLKWVSTLARDAVWIQTRPPGREQLPGWIAARLRQAGLSCDDDALELLAARVEGNLLAARQEIDKLVLLARDGHVGADTVRRSVADGARYDVYQLADAALAGDGVRAVRVLHGLRAEGVAPPLVLWSLARDIGTLADILARIHKGRPPGRAISEAGVWQSRQQLFARAAGTRDHAAGRRLLAIACHADRIIKGARPGQPWNALQEVTLALAGSRQAVAETA